MNRLVSKITIFSRIFGILGSSSSTYFETFTSAAASAAGAGAATGGASAGVSRVEVLGLFMLRFFIDSIT